RLAVALGGDLGVFALAAASGIADVDAVTISMARLGGASITPGTAAAAILLTAGVNTVAKSVLAVGAGGRMPGLHVALASAGALVAGLAALTVAGPEGLLGRVVAAAIGA